MSTSPNYSAIITLKKGVLAVLELVLSVLLAMLPQFVDSLYALVDEAHELEALHVPVAYVPFVLFAVRAAFNYLKNRGR